jgi:arabinofuranosyltransferase
MTTDDRSRVRAAWNPVTSIDRTERLLLVIFASVLVALWLPRVLIGCSLTVAEERYWYLGDDAMISMRYAHNLADGIGLVWNPGERVEGYTNFLWTMYMAVVTP